MLDMLSEADMLGCKAMDTPMDSKLKLFLDYGEPWKTKDGIGD